MLEMSVVGVERKLPNDVQIDADDPLLRPPCSVGQQPYQWATDPLTRRLD